MKKVPPNVVRAFVDAARNDSLGVIKAIFNEYPGAINKQNAQGSTALMSAARFGRKEALKLLLQLGADVNEKTPKGTALTEAAAGGNAAVARLLLEAGADVNRTNSEGWTPLMASVSHDSLNLPRLLQEYKADVHAKNSDGETALMLAETYDKTEVAAFIAAWEVKELTDELADFSPALKRSIPAVPRLKVPPRPH